MELELLKATPHPAGNQIELSWLLPGNSTYTGVRVVRRTGSYPSHPDDGVIVLHDVGVEKVSDTGLHAEQVYYYMLFPFSGVIPVFDYDKKNRISAVATSPQNFSGYMYDLLPAIYHRYDKDSQILQRFL